MNLEAALLVVIAFWLAAMSLAYVLIWRSEKTDTILPRFAGHDPSAVEKSSFCGRLLCRAGNHLRTPKYLRTSKTPGEIVAMSGVWSGNGNEWELLGVFREERVEGNAFGGFGEYMARATGEKCREAGVV